MRRKNARATGRRSGIAMALALVAVLGASAHADKTRANADLDKARRALGDLKYSAALAALDKALERGGNSPETLAEIYQLKGQVAASLGQEDAAVESFQHLLAMNPNASLDSGVSPKIGEPFHAARKALEDKGEMRVSCRIRRGAGANATLVVESDPVEMVHGAAVLLDDDSDRPLTPEPKDPFRVGLPSGAAVSAVVAVDAFGNHVRIIPVSECEDVTPVKRVRKKAEPHGRGAPPIYARWALWAGVALASGAVGTYFGLEAKSTLEDLDRLNMESSNHEFAEADDLESRARKNALWANLGFAAAGAATITAAILYLRADRRQRERSAVLAPTAGRDSIGMALFLPF